MKQIILSLITCLFFLFGYSQTVYSDYLDGAIWVKFKNNEVQIEELYVRNGVVRNNQIALTDLSDYPFYNQLKQFQIQSIQVSFPAIKDPLLQNLIRIEFEDINNVDEIIKILEKSELVDYAERVPLLKSTFTPNDPYYNASLQWSLFTTNASTAWNISTGSASIKVAIVDDAIDITHPDLSSTIYTNTGEIPNNGIDDDNNGYIDDVNGYDVANGDNNPNPDSPDFDHGTHVAGISGASTNNGIGVASIGSGISIVPVKSTKSSTAVTHGYEGIYYAAAVNADVINMSWGSSGFSTTAENIINYAYNNGAVLIASAGNDDSPTVSYPAGYSNVIAVASTDSYDKKSSFSNYGAWVDVSAPGSSIYSTVVGGGYDYKSGTSMASPIVAGLTGLMLSHNPSLTQAEVKNCILSTSVDIYALNTRYPGQLGTGRIDALAAMNCVDATLSNPPVSQFIANSTSILNGQSVSFMDLTTGNSSSWTWSFAGGTPSTFIGQNPPPILYNTVGVYDVSLTTKNINGSSTETKKGYITVNSLSSCDTITNTLSTDPNSVYTWGTGNGAMFGHNYIQQQFIAEKYTGYGPTFITGTTFNFTNAISTSASDKITIKVWEDFEGLPGNIVYSEDVLLSDIVPNITTNNFIPSNFIFDQPVSVTTGDFYVGFELYYGSGGYIELSSSSNFSTNPLRQNSAYYYVNPSNNPRGVAAGWVEIDNIVSTSFEVALHIYPTITSNPPFADISVISSPICKGQSVKFNGLASKNASSYNWTINGASSPMQTGSSPSVIMNTAGTHKVYLTVSNNCGFEHTDSVVVNVAATPAVSISSSQSMICATESAKLTATGANSYLWTPATGLSCTTCPNPIASPINTTTYTVEGSDGTCSSKETITITVDNSPVKAGLSLNKSTICVGESLKVDGSSSTGAQTYNWTFDGGTPSSGTGMTSSSIFNSSGKYWVVLEVVNSCNVNDKDSLEVTVLSKPDISVTASSVAICPSESTNLTATGASSFVWSPAVGLSCTTCPNPVASPTNTTTYTVEGFNGICSSTEKITITVDNSPLSANLNLSKDLVCVDEILEVDGSSSVGAQTYNWTFEGGTPNSGTGVTSSTLYNTSGTYAVKLEVENACGVTDVMAKNIIVISEEECTSSLVNIENNKPIIFYSSQQDNIVIKSPKKGEAFVLNSAGQKVIISVFISVGEDYIDTKRLSKGLYMIVFNTKDGKIKTTKFVK